MNHPKRILIVADNLEEFRNRNRCFEELPREWEVRYSQSTGDAVFCARHSDFDVIFADLSEGPMAGADVLYELRLRQPNSIRFLLTDGLDKDVMTACAKGVHQVLQKPLDGEMLKQALERAELVHELLRDEQIQKLAASIRIFPSRPKVYLELLRELRSPMGSVEAAGRLVEQDLGISAKLLQVVNSAYFGLERRISSPAEAVLHLGTQTAAPLVLALEVFAQFDHLHPNYFAIDHVWKHSQTVADGARRIAETVTKDPDIIAAAYAAGLLHDIGKLALSINIKEEYGGVLRLARQRGVPVWQAENDAFGATHAAVGAYLLAAWGMPAAVIRAVAGHHAPASTLPLEFTSATAVHLANTLEYARVPLRQAFFGFAPDLDYPAELGLEHFLERFHNRLPSAPSIAVSGEGGTGGGFISTRVE